MKRLLIIFFLLSSIVAQAQFRRYASVPASASTPVTYAAIPAGDLPASVLFSGVTNTFTGTNTTFAVPTGKSFRIFTTDDGNFYIGSNISNLYAGFSSGGAFVYNFGRGGQNNTVDSHFKMVTQGFRYVIDGEDNDKSVEIKNDDAAMRFDPLDGLTDGQVASLGFAMGDSIDGPSDTHGVFVGVFGGKDFGEDYAFLMKEKYAEGGLRPAIVKGDDGSLVLDGDYVHLGLRGAGGDGANPEGSQILDVQFDNVNIESPVDFRLRLYDGTTNGTYGSDGQVPTVQADGSILYETPATVADGDKGDITISGSGSTYTIDNSAVTYAKIQNGTGLSLVGRSANSSGVNADITGTANQILRANGAGTSIGFGSIDLSASAAVGATILGVANGGTGSASQNFVDISTNQSGLAGNKTWTGTHIFTTGVSTGTGTTAGLQITANSLTTGNGLDISSNNVTTGNVVNLASTSTAVNGNAVLNIASSGSNANSTRTAYGVKGTVTNTGTSSTNIAGFFSASGGTTNKAIQINNGSFEQIRTSDFSSAVTMQSVLNNTSTEIFNLDNRGTGRFNQYNSSGTKIGDIILTAPSGNPGIAINNSGATNRYLLVYVPGGSEYLALSHSTTTSTKVSIGMGAGTAPTATLQSRGAGTTTGSNFLFERSDGGDLLELLDNGKFFIKTTPTVMSGVTQPQYLTRDASTGEVDYIAAPKQQESTNTGTTYSNVIMIGQIPNDSQYFLQVIGSGIESDGSDGYSFEVKAAVKNDGGTYSIVGVNSTDIRSTGVTTATVTIVSNAVQLDVATGLSGSVKNSYKVVVLSSQDY